LSPVAADIVAMPLLMLLPPLRHADEEIITLMP